jgi:hypothetical protein
MVQTLNIVKYREFNIEATRSGWFVVFIPDHGFLKADTLDGSKRMVDQYIKEKKHDRTN